MARGVDPPGVIEKILAVELEPGETENLPPDTPMESEMFLPVEPGETKNLLPVWHRAGDCDSRAPLDHRVVCRCLELRQSVPRSAYKPSSGSEA